MFIRKGDRDSSMLSSSTMPIYRFTLEDAIYIAPEKLEKGIVKA